MGLMKRFLWRRVKKAFREKTGEDLPVDMEQLQEVMKYLQKSHARNAIMYDIVLELGTLYIQPKRLEKIMRDAVVRSTEDMDMIKANIESLVTTLAIVQGMNMAEDELTEPEVNPDG